MPRLAVIGALVAAAVSAVVWLDSPSELTGPAHQPPDGFTELLASSDIQQLLADPYAGVDRDGIRRRIEGRTAVLLEGLRAPEARRRLAAARLLSMMEPLSGIAETALVSALISEREPSVSTELMHTIRDHGLELEASRSAVLEALKSDSSRIELYMAVATSTSGTGRLVGPIGRIAANQAVASPYRVLAIDALVRLAERNPSIRKQVLEQVRPLSNDPVLAMRVVAQMYLDRLESPETVSLPR